MKLNQLLRGVALTGCRADQDVEITGVSYDTRTMAPGGLFAALEGYKTDSSISGRRWKKGRWRCSAAARRTLTDPG